jgi:ABC-type Fe3+-hydroxamate transport system substrate-binding protein
MKYIDHTGYNFTLPRQPQRIISLVPSQTELLYYLGIEPIGQTIFCFHPASKFKNSTKIGGTKNLQLSKIDQLKPDLIIGNKEENNEEQIEYLRKRYPVWLSDIKTIVDSIDMITSIGDLIGKTEQAADLSHRIEQGFDNLNLKKKASILYIIWRGPYMAAGKDTYINSMIEASGYSNALELDTLRYPSITNKEITESEPDEIWLSSEPYPFKDKHIEELQEIAPKAHIKLVDGELFSWYGPRMLKTIDYLSK